MTQADYDIAKTMHMDASELFKLSALCNKNEKYKNSFIIVTRNTLIDKGGDWALSGSHEIECQFIWYGKSLTPAYHRNPAQIRYGTYIITPGNNDLMTLNNDFTALNPFKFNAKDYIGSILLIFIEETIIKKNGSITHRFLAKNI